MAFVPVSPVAGAAVPGLTGPTYTLGLDVAPSMNGKQYAVTALGGTQTNVVGHSVSSPFTLTFFRPQVLRSIPEKNPISGVIKNIPVNTYKLITRKGAMPGSGQNPMVARITTIIEVPAGTETFDTEDINAMISLHFGAGSAAASGIADTVKTGVL